MPDDERIQLMLKVKEGSITMEDALDKVCRIVLSQLVLQIALTLMLLVANLANKKRCKTPGK